MLTRSRAALGLTALLTAGALSLAACASNSEDTGPAANSNTDSSSPATSNSADAALTALVPDKIKSAGKLVVGVNVPYSPNEYLDASGKVVGFDVDLLNAVAGALGLTADYRQAEFAKIVPAVKAGTYDMGMSSFTDTKEREATDDFVDYFSAGVLWASPAGKTVDPANACGLKVAVQSDTYEVSVLAKANKACASAGKDKITVQQYESQDDATNVLVLGKVDAMTADSPVTAYAIKQTGGKLQPAGQITEAAPYGWPVAKGSKLGAALQKALQSLIDDGTYGRILDKWGMKDGAVKTASLNGATS